MPNLGILAMMGKPPAGGGTPPAATHLLTGGNATNQVDYTTASVSPAEGFVMCYVSSTGINASTAPTVSGAGLTWTLVDWDGYGIYQWGYMYVGTGTPSAGALTISHSAVGAVTGCSWSIVEFSGAASVEQSQSGNAGSGATSLAVTLDIAPASGSTVFAGFSTYNNNESITAPGFDTLADQLGSSNPVVRIATFAAEGDAPTSITGSWTSSTNAAGVAVEIGA